MFNKSNETIDIKVLGMTCPHCSKAVETALMAVDGVKKAKVALSDGIVTVTLKNKVDIAILAAAIDGAGYRAEV